LYMSLLTSNCTCGCNCTGTKQDGHASYFFHKKVNLCNDKNGKFISWRKAGASISIILDGTLQGFKEVFVLYAFKNSDNSPQRTDWELHQYHMKNTIEDEGELVVSKIFYNSQSNHCERAAKAPVQSAQVLFVLTSAAIAQLEFLMKGAIMSYQYNLYHFHRLQLVL
jgi:hypothetical protein